MWGAERGDCVVRARGAAPHDGPQHVAAPSCGVDFSCVGFGAWGGAKSTPRRGDCVANQTSKLWLACTVQASVIQALAEILHWLPIGFSHTPITPSLMLCACAGSVFGDGSHEVVQDFGNGTHPEHSNVLVWNIKHGVEGWRCCVWISGAGFLPHTVTNTTANNRKTS